MPAGGAGGARFPHPGDGPDAGRLRQPFGEPVEQARPALTLLLLQRARRFVRANCCDPGLTPEKVAAQIGASRTTLYRAFQPKGGISEYIRLSRLDAARAALTEPKDPRRISEIGYAHGFQSEAQFSRAMRAAFGATPSELRNERRDFRSGYTDELWAQRGWIDETMAGVQPRRGQRPRPGLAARRGGRGGADATRGAQGGGLGRARGLRQRSRVAAQAQRVAGRRQAEQPRVFAAELRRAFVADGVAGAAASGSATSSRRACCRRSSSGIAAGSSRSPP